MVINGDMQNRLIEKLLQGEATWKERYELAQNTDIESEMQRQWEASEDMMKDKDTEARMWRNIEKGLFRKQRLSLRSIGRAMAAACAVLATVAGAWLAMDRTDENIVPGDDMQEIFSAASNCMYMLPDSSLVWMQPGSTIRYSRNFDTDRSVWLSGESVFEVMKREKSPFRVYVGKAFVEVKGTVFNVMNDGRGKSEVTLYDGTVEFDVKSSGKKITMEPGQRIIYSYTAGGRENVELNHTSKMDWSRGRYRFADIPMTDLLQCIGDIYHVQVEFAGNVPPHYRFTGFIRYDETLEDVLGKICLNTELKLKKQENKYTIYK